jgi:hypothetical protein
MTDRKPTMHELASQTLDVALLELADHPMTNREIHECLVQVSELAAGKRTAKTDGTMPAAAKLYDYIVAAATKPFEPWKLEALSLAMAEEMVERMRLEQGTQGVARR